jgi:hypothetical protein
MFILTDQQNKQLIIKKTTDFIIKHITNTLEFGSNITFALKHHKPYDMDKHKPKLQSSKAKNDEDKAVEN